MKLKDLEVLNLYPTSVIKNMSVKDKKCSNGFTVKKYNLVFVEVITDSNVTNKVCEYILKTLNRCSDMNSVSHVFINCKPHSTVFPSSSVTNVRDTSNGSSHLQYMLIYIDNKIRYIISRIDNTLVEYKNLPMSTKTIINKLVKQLS